MHLYDSPVKVTHVHGLFSPTRYDIVDDTRRGSEQHGVAETTMILLVPSETDGF